MQSLKRAGILLIVLGLPALIFLFLHGFGRNEFVIPVLYENGVESSFASCNFSNGQHFIPDFSFVNQLGETSNGSLMEGNITVVDFFFSTCPDICPAMTNHLTRVHDEFSKNDRVKIISFTVDPAHDTPDVLFTYAARFKADANKWQFLTGDKAKLYSLARCGFILLVVDGEGDRADFIHSDKLILVDGKRRIRGYYSGTDREDVDRLITEVNILGTERDSEDE